MKHLKEFGWDPFVLCIQESNSKLTGVESENLEGIKIFKLQPPFDRTSSPKPNGKSDSKTAKKENKLANWVDDHFPIDTWLPFFWMKKNEISDIILKVNPDVIWSTSDPWSGGYIAGKIAKELDKKWIADFRDPWTLCSVRFPQKGFFAQKIEEHAEKWIASNSDYMTFTAKETERRYVKYYPELKDRSETIYNSFDVDQEVTNEENSSNPERLEILFLGTFRWLSDAKLIIQILGRVKEKEPKLFHQIHLSSYGLLEIEDKAFALERGVFEAFKVRDKVPVELVQKEIDTADILLLSTHSERDEIVPAKLVDYLPSTKPILSIVPSIEVGDILKRTGRGIQFSKNEIEEASELLIECVKAKQNGKMLPFNLVRNEEEISKFDSRSTTEQLAEVLTKVSENE